MNTNENTLTVKSVLRVIGAIFRKIGAVLATLTMVMIITGCIVASVLTVYVLQSIDAEEPITLDSLKRGYTSSIVALDKSGAEVEVRKLYIADNNRVPANIEDVSPFVIDAVIAIEDKRFLSHNGVDWKRTTGAFLNMFLGFYDSNAGGSTIHQQLIKNITGDDEFRVDRKVQEIFRAINLAQLNTHEQVMESYLNIVSFGAGTRGIETAANLYFDKSAKDLTLAESAAIVGITKFPTAYNPLFYLEANKKRQGDVLDAMFKQGKITQEEYDKAWKEPLNFQEKEEMENILEPSSFFTDHVIQTVISDLMKKNNSERQDAANELYMGGYTIYTTQDIEMQEYLEDFYLSEKNFPPIARTEYPQSGCVITDHNGKILAMVGELGPKTESLSFNRVTMAKRQPGSTLKPIGPYALAFEYDLITPSTIISDSPINPDADPNDWYPKNYYGDYFGPVTVERAIIRSINTVAVKVTQMVTPATLFDHYYYDLNMTSLIDPTDIDLAPMALGGVTEGVTPLELAGAYQIIVNGGYFTKPYPYSKVVDSNGRTVLKPDTTARPVISEDTSVLLNKMTQEVVRSGTGAHAKLANMPTAGKTGTSNDDVDQWFVGLTPYYICNVWLGYDQPYTENKYGNRVRNSVLYSPNPYPTPPLFKSIMEPLHEGLEAKEFLDSPDVIQRAYCNITGNLAVEGCPTASTWYKASNLPPACSGVHSVAGQEGDTSETGNGEGSASSGSGSSATSSSGSGSADKDRVIVDNRPSAPENTPDVNVNPVPDYE